MKKVKLTGAEIIWECLLREQVNIVFGYPGGAILPTYDALSKYSDRIHHVLPGMSRELLTWQMAMLVLLVESESL